MQVNSLNILKPSFGTKRYDVEDKSASIKETSVQSATEGIEILDSYNRMLVKRPADFDISLLEHRRLDEVFEHDELIPPTQGGLNISSIITLAYSHMKEQMQYLEKTGELIPYKTRELLEECKYMGLNEEETKEYIQNKKEEFKEYITSLRQEAADCIDKISPTKTAHEIYRVINDSSIEDAHNYFLEQSSVKKGENITLSTCPIYVSTSSKGIMKSYGRSCQNGILYKIILPEGSKLLKFPSSDGIEQCIMKPDAKFEVVDNEEYKNNFHFITLKYLPE